MLFNNLTTLDFETEGIEGNPLLAPPKPVGLAVRWPAGDTDYITSWGQMAEAFRVACLHGPTLYHNASFDLSVARHWFGIEWPHWSQIHDTMYLVYLRDPYARSYGLKPSAERYLNLPPEEQDACEAWIRANIPNVGKDWGKFLCKVPEHILAPYAIGDVQRTFDLYAALAPDTPQEPYDRERELMPRLVEATRTGVRCATGPLADALEQATKAFEQVDDMLRAALQAPGLNPGSSGQLADALEERGLVEDWVLTPTGAKSCDMKNLRVADPHIMNLLKYRSTSKTLIGTFMKPWLEMADEAGRLHPNWNSTRGDRAGGTRTGRLSSSSPNFQNIPNPAGITEIPGLPPLPHLRDFILPEEGHLWVKRDFSAQEIRVMAHFEDGALAEAFRQDPYLDPHELVRQEVLKITGVDYPRKYIKETGFGILYGMGRYTLAERLQIRSNEAWDLMVNYKRAIPGVDKLQKGTRRRGYADQPIKTWGGRLIYKEPARIVKGEMRSFEYKLLNYLIQGSSADQTKQCILDWFSHLDCGEVFMATVHDEINISAPEDKVDEAMEHLRICMDETCEFDVPMRSEGFIGPSWGEVGDE